MRSFGMQVRLLVDEKNELIAGHGRYLAAKQLGLTKVPVIRIDHLTPDQIKAFRISDNRLSQFDARLEILDDEPKQDPADNIIEPANGPSVSKLGDVQVLGTHRLLCGSALVPGDLVYAAFPGPATRAKSIKLPLVEIVILAVQQRGRSREHTGLPALLFIAG